jgi:hypothetical protein
MASAVSVAHHFSVAHRKHSERPPSDDHPANPPSPATSGTTTDGPGGAAPGTIDAMSCAFSLDTDLLCIGTTRGGVKLLHSSAGFRPATFELTSALCRGEAMRSAVTSVRFRPGPDRAVKDVLLVGSTDGSVSEWHLGSVQMLFADCDPSNEVYAVDYEPMGAAFCSTGKNCVVKVFDAVRKCNVLTMRWTQLTDSYDAHSSRVQAVRWAETNTILSGGWDNTVQVWDTRCGKAVNRIFGVYLCGDGLDVHGNMIVTASTRPEHNLQLWDLRTLRPFVELDFPIAPSTLDSVEPRRSNLFAAKFSPDGAFLAAGGTLDFRVFDMRATLAGIAKQAATAASAAAAQGTTPASAAAEEQGETKIVTPVDCGRALSAGGVAGAVFGVAWSRQSLLVAACGYGNSLVVLQR